MRQFLIFFLFLLTPAFLSAWGANGHRIVAQICYDNLNPTARQRVDAALGDNLLAQVSTWPDYIKAESGWDFAKPWHYTTVNTDRTAAQVATLNGAREGIDDVREGIELMTAILSGEEKAISQFTALMGEHDVEPLAGSIEATALAFLIHFVGDVHQPMHVGKNRDLGGNRITVQFFGERKNLHSVWDSGIIEKERLSYTEFAAFASIHTRSHKEKWMRDGLETWIKESIVLREQIYDTIYDETDRETGLPKFSYRYQHDYLPIVEERLAAAGYRAAALLNDLLGTP